VNSDIPTNSSK